MSVFTWGLGKSGQLGNGKKENCENPQEVKQSKSVEVVGLETGALFTALVSKDGKVITFGCGKHGRLGTGNEEDSDRPTLVEGLSDFKIKMVCQVQQLLIR